MCRGEFTKEGIIISLVTHGMEGGRREMVERLMEHFGAGVYSWREVRAGYFSSGFRY